MGDEPSPQRLDVLQDTVRHLSSVHAGPLGDRQRDRGMRSLGRAGEMGDIPGGFAGAVGHGGNVAEPHARSIRQPHQNSGHVLPPLEEAARPDFDPPVGVGHGAGGQHRVGALQGLHHVAEREPVGR